MKIHKYYIDCKLTPYELSAIIKFTGLSIKGFHRQYIESSDLPWSTFYKYTYVKVPVWFCRFISCEPAIYKIVILMADKGDLHHVNSVRNAAKKLNENESK